MSASGSFLSPTQAARRLGVSPKALRIYEAHGLLRPGRTPAGWRAYGPDDMRRGGEIAALRGLGFSLAQVRRTLDGETAGLEPALAAHQERLEAELGAVSRRVGRVRALREALAAGRPPSIAELTGLAHATTDPLCAFALPWPWGGERFELRPRGRLTWITGPLGSGKTRLARAIADHIPGGVFLPMERLDEPPPSISAALAARVEAAVAWLAEDGASAKPALAILLAALEDDRPGALVVDMVEHGLDEATERAVATHVRRRRADAPPLFLMTRSSAMLDLDVAGPDEGVLYCPPNHSPPLWRTLGAGAAGHDAITDCLAPPQVRARTAGMIATLPEGVARAS
ncbi:MAG: MerR family transcriptional regulator [Phenylobacterium zucineum]|nr:MAG: MerR family transcriptional regulator [Phenylobacterium zucineum]